MSEFQLTREARKDLKKIAIFTEKRWGRKQQYLYIKQFDDAFHCLAETLSVGGKCDEIKMGCRKAPQGSYIIFCRKGTKNKIMLIRILHKNMDIESRLLNT